MPIARQRSRMISVRLSEDEYTALRRLCEITGSRSVSELARMAMRVLITGQMIEGGLGERLDVFYATVRQLEKRVEELATRGVALPSQVQE